MKFDWYAATIQDHEQNIVHALYSGLKADAVEKMKGGQHGYSGGYFIKRGGGTVASVLAGGGNPFPSAKASGSVTPEFVDCVRGAYGDKHHVSRVDCCTDFDEPQAWERLSAVVEAIAIEHRLTVTKMESSGAEGSKGKTLYVGAPSSSARVRVYMKGYEMAEKFPHQASEFSRDWVRVEAQLRPQKEARNTLAKVSALEAWGASRTTRFIVNRCLSTCVPRIAGPRHDLTDNESAAQWMAGQYTNVLTWKRQQFATGEEFSRDLFRLVDQAKAEKVFAGVPVVADEVWHEKQKDLAVSVLGAPF